MWSFISIVLVIVLLLIVISLYSDYSAKKFLIEENLNDLLFNKELVGQFTFQDLLQELEITDRADVRQLKKALCRLIKAERVQVELNGSTLPIGCRPKLWLFSRAIFWRIPPEFVSPKSLHP